MQDEATPLALLFATPSCILHVCCTSRHTELHLHLHLQPGVVAATVCLSSTVCGVKLTKSPELQPLASVAMYWEEAVGYCGITSSSLKAGEVEHVTTVLILRGGRTRWLYSEDRGNS